jgi:hypothetical protein
MVHTVHSMFLLDIISHNIAIFHTLYSLRSTLGTNSVQTGYATARTMNSFLNCVLCAV